MSKLHESYVEQAGCYNCEHVFKRACSEGPEYYCYRDKSAKPFSNRRASIAWHSWRKVKMWGLCDMHRPKGASCDKAPAAIEPAKQGHVVSRPHGGVVSLRKKRMKKNRDLLVDQLKKDGYVD